MITEKTQNSKLQKETSRNKSLLIGDFFMRVLRRVLDLKVARTLSLG